MREETKISPESPLPWLELSQLALKHGQTAESHSATAKADALHPTQQSTREQRIILRYAGGASATSSAETKENPELWNKAMQEYAARQYEPAVTDLKLWLKAHPGNGTAWAVLGLGEFAMRDFDNALIHLNRGESLGLTGSPDSVRTAKYTQAILCIRAGQFDRASELLASILKQNPQDEKAEYGLGLALLRRAELPQPTNEHHAQLMRTAGKIAALLQDSRYDEAFPLFKRLLDEHPSEPFLHYAYGSALLALSEFDEASAQMRAEMSVSPQSELPYIRLASIALKQHKAADAIPYSKRALLLSPQSAEAHYLLGRASMEVGDDTSAVHELEIAANLSPTSPEVHFNLAKAYSRAKMPEAAEKERATFARLNELSDMEKNRSGSQIYTGPHDANDVSTPSNPGTPKPN
jgi:predicted Zn-dependent protease